MCRYCNLRLLRGCPHHLQLWCRHLFSAMLIISSSGKRTVEHGYIWFEDQGVLLLLFIICFFPLSILAKKKHLVLGSLRVYYSPEYLQFLCSRQITVLLYIRLEGSPFLYYEKQKIQFLNRWIIIGVPTYNIKIN